MPKVMYTAVGDCGSERVGQILRCRVTDTKPRLRVGVSPGSRLSRSFALPCGPGSTPNLSVDKALVRPEQFGAIVLHKEDIDQGRELRPHNRNDREKYQVTSGGVWRDGNITITET